MNIQFFILTYNRPKVLQSCIQTALENTTVRPNAIHIFDDGSAPEIKRALLEFSIVNSSPEMPVNVEFHGINMGVGWNFENLYRKIEQHSPDIAVIIESDYIWRKGWLEDVVAVFEASPYTIMIPGTSHPDFRDRVKTHKEFPALMVEQFGRDLESREDLYAPFTLETTRGPILVQGGSNSCGCLVLYYRRLQQILNANPVDGRYNQIQYKKWLARAFHRWGNTDRTRASDAHMSSTLSMFAEMYMKDLGIDITKNFGVLDICDYSISSHRALGGINGNVYGMQEGDTFLHSTGWDMKYLTEDPRKV